LRNETAVPGVQGCIPGLLHGLILKLVRNGAKQFSPYEC
jgi:hypothetical protein